MLHLGFSLRDFLQIHHAAATPQLRPVTAQAIELHGRRQTPTGSRTDHA